MKADRTERGWPAHFIGAADCVFRRNTLVTFANAGAIVSTVGQYRPLKKSTEMIGHNRWYETFVFPADMEDKYKDAASMTELMSDGIYAESVVGLPEFADNVANDMHETMVIKVTKKLESGWIPMMPSSEEMED